MSHLRKSPNAASQLADGPPAVSVHLISMSNPIEVRLRIPKNSNAPLLDDSGYPLDTASVRFRKVMTVTAIPKAGESIELIAGPRTLPATVLRADWSDADGKFVVACQYAQRSISVEEQNALVADPEWSLVPLI